MACNFSMKDHIPRVAENGEWKSHTEIKAAASLFQRSIHVVLLQLQIILNNIARAFLEIQGSIALG